MPDYSVVVPWDAGKYHFRYRWQRWLFRWIVRRWSGWTNWSVLSDEEKATAVRPHIRRPNRMHYR